MPINSQNPGYDAAKSKLTTDAFSGDVQDYIPRLTGQTNKEYEQYQTRATYYNVVKRTNSALTGAMLRKPYTTNIDVDEVVIFGELHFDEFLSEAISDIMNQGRIGLLVDFSEFKQSPYIVSYDNASIINWQEVEGILTLVVLREDTFVPKENDPYDYDKIVQYRELRIDEDGLYQVRVWKEDGRKKFELIDSYEPSIRGQRFDVIPFTFVNTKTTTPKVEEPTLYNLAQVNISHFKTSADIEHSAHFTALPQPYISGDLKEEQSSLPIGTYEVWQLDQDAAVGYLEFSGSGIGALQNISVQKEEQMANMGASLLQGRKGVESAEALRIRQGSESSALLMSAQATESGIQQVLSIYSLWSGRQIEVEFELSKDFTASKLTPAELKGYVDAFLAGTISQDTFLQNLYAGEIIDDVEKEKKSISINTTQEL